MNARETELLQLLQELKEMGEGVQNGTELTSIMEQYEEKLLNYMIHYPLSSTDNSSKT